MLLKELSLYQFRNLQTQTLVFPSRVTLVVGKNGQGKTSLLEAIYLLAHSRSFRESKTRELVAWEKSSKRSVDCSVHALAETASGPKTISYEIQKGRREICINHKRIEQARSFYGEVLVVEFTPEELQLVKGEPSLRRAYLDKILAMVDKRFVDSLVSYQRALKNRNALLQQYRKSSGKDPRAMQKLLLSWNEPLLEHGLALASQRQELTKRLSPLCQGYYAELIGEDSSKNHDEKVSIQYRSDFLSGETLMEREELREVFLSNAARDLHSGKTNFGVHHDDLLTLLNTGSGDRPARRAASQGQARSLSLALKLTAIDFIVEETGENPILLLDDVESELDASRRDALYKIISELVDYQVFITSTEASELFFTHNLDGQILHMDEGLVTAFSASKSEAEFFN